MSEFLAGLAGVIVGGALGLVGVRWNLNAQAVRDRLADARSLRDRKHDRLRKAYSEIVAAADAYPKNAALLGILLIQAQREGKWTAFLDRVQERSRDTTDAHAALLVESDQDQEVLGLLGEIATANMGFGALLLDDLKGEEVSADEQKRLLLYMGERAERLAALARQRLAELEKPIQ